MENRIYGKLRAWAVVGLAGLIHFASRAAIGGDSFDSRRQQVEQLSPDEKQQLLNKVERFQQLDPAEQQRLRTLHARLEQAPDAAELTSILDRYHAWMATLGASQRAELLQLEPAERVRRIKQLMTERSNMERMRSMMFVKLNPHDREAIAVWVERQTLSGIPPDKRTDLEQLSPQDRRRALGALFMRRMTSFDPSQRMAIGPETYLQLRESLSPESQQRLDQSDSPGRRAGLWMSWLGQAMGTGLTEEQFQNFFERELRPEDRQRLLSLPADDMQRELRRLFYERSDKGFGFPRRDDSKGGPPRGERPPFNGPPGNGPPGNGPPRNPPSNDGKTPRPPKPAA